MSKEKLVELIRRVTVSTWTFSDLADYILADGWIRPPCKVGDIVYVIFKAYNEEKVYPVNVSAIRMDTKKNNNRVCVWGTFHITKFYAHEYKATFKFDSIGKTVFLTREEAEKKLKEGENNA